MQFLGKKFWKRDRFPIVYEKNKAKAMLIDIEPLCKD